MKRKLLRSLASLIQAAILVMIVGSAYANEPAGYKIVDGIALYYAVIPAEMVRGHPKEHPEGAMHGGVPSGKHFHHVMVAVFVAKTLDRITDAEVKATVSEIGLSGETKTLEPFTIAGALTYGNYFEMPSKTIYRIKVEVRRPGSPETIETEFEYTHH
ncbi:MAG: hypothetical protein HY245_01310 [Rhizobiales bacterium]|nr:hypothetical protein [Hyphomicrobiales bacterium]MBI3672068.1 hypothetical protein [Hyphomicrobiales bacterium]